MLDVRCVAFCADLPGMKQEDIEISVQDNLLTLQGKRAVEYATQNGQNGHGYQYTERASGLFCRRFFGRTPVIFSGMSV